jgi:hypothetical protein
MEQLALFSFPEPPPPAELPPDLVEKPDLTSYDYYVVAFSGGKDSCSSLLHLIESGVDRSRIELFHHDVDGKNPFFDWPVTTSYCEAVAKAFGVPIYMSWREGGFLREMLRNGTPTAPVIFEKPDGTLGKAGGEGPIGTRLRFPRCLLTSKLDSARPPLKSTWGRPRSEGRIASLASEPSSSQGNVRKRAQQGHAINHSSPIDQIRAMERAGHATSIIGAPSCNDLRKKYGRS